MNFDWSLKELYESFDCNEFLKDFEMLDIIISDINAWVDKNFESQDNPGSKIELYLKKINEYESIYTKLYRLADLTLSVDVKNETAIKTVNQLESKITKLKRVEVIFQKWLTNLSNLDEIVKETEYLKEHYFYLKEYTKNSKYLLSEKEEILYEKMKLTGSNAWTKLYYTLSSSLMVDIRLNGENQKLPIAVVRNMAYDKDGSLRKLAYEAELESYKKVEDGICAALNGIKGEVINITKMRGYTSPFKKTLSDSRIDEDTINAMFTAIKEYLPEFRKYFKRKSEYLGHKNGLPFYELFAPIGNAESKFSYDEAKSFIVNNISKFNDEAGAFVDNAFSKRWIDVNPKEGKRDGAFCARIHTIKESRILANFSNNFGSVKILAHELGHAFHNYCQENETFLNIANPMPAAETASIFFETLVKNAAMEKASKNEQLLILESELANNAQIIVDIFSRFLFEDEVFKRRENSIISKNELKDIMIKSQLESYGDGLDKNYLHPYMWACKVHYYLASQNYYNFPYSFGLLFAKGLYSKYLKESKEFYKEYKKMLSITGKMRLVDVAKTMNIDINSVEYWKSALKIIKHDIDKFLDII